MRVAEPTTERSCTWSHMPALLQPRPIVRSSQLVSTTLFPSETSGETTLCFFGLSKSIDSVTIVLPPCRPVDLSKNLGSALQGYSNNRQSVLATCFSNTLPWLLWQRVGRSDSLGLLDDGLCAIYSLNDTSLDCPPEDVLSLKTCPTRLQSVNAGAHNEPVKI